MSSRLQGLRGSLLADIVSKCESKRAKKKCMVLGLCDRLPVDEVRVTSTITDFKMKKGGKTKKQDEENRV